MDVEKYLNTFSLIDTSPPPNLFYAPTKVDTATAAAPVYNQNYLQHQYIFSAFTTINDINMVPGSPPESETTTSNSPSPAASPPSTTTTFDACPSVAATDTTPSNVNQCTLVQEPMHKIIRRQKNTEASRRHRKRKEDYKQMLENQVREQASHIVELEEKVKQLESLLFLDSGQVFSKTK